MADWRGCFPELGVYRPMHLLRRCGPLLVGIVLERDSGNFSYRPTFHVHDLAVENSAVTLTLAHELRTRKTGAPETIDVKHHGAKYQEAAGRLSGQAPLPLQGDLLLSDVLTAYRSFIQRPTTHYQPELYEDMALLCAWGSRQDLAHEILEQARSTMQSWPSEVLDMMGGLEAWVDGLASRLAHPDRIRETVARQIEAHGVQKLPVGELRVG